MSEDGRTPFFLSDRAMFFGAALLMLALNVALTTCGVLLALVGGRTVAVCYYVLLAVSVGSIVASAIARQLHLRRCAREGRAPDPQTLLVGRRRSFTWSP